MYRDLHRYQVYPIGSFIDPQTVVAEHCTRKRILFVNPVLKKGVGIVIQLALLLEKIRPEIKFEVVDSHGSWNEILKCITPALGKVRKSLRNLIITPVTDDMKQVYTHARVVLMQSLCFER